MNNNEKLINALVAPLQDLEDTLQAMLTQRAVDTAVGAQLDVLGRIVGQPRAGLTDDYYRRYIRARVATNRSKGTSEDALNIARLVISDTNASLILANQGIAAFVVKWLGTVADPVVAAILSSFLQEGAAAGVRVIVEYLTALDADTFFTAVTAFANGAMTAGNTSITVGSTAGFPPSGSLVVDAGLAVAETVTYTSILGTQFLGVSALAHNHVDQTAISLSTGPGKGLGDSSVPATGGMLAGAI